MNNHPIDGRTFSTLSLSSLLTMGFNVGEAHHAHQIFSEYFFGSYRSPPFNSYATWDPPGPEWEYEQTPTGNAHQRSLVKQNAIEVSKVSVVE